MAAGGEGALQRDLKGHDESVTSVAYSRDGKFLASGSWDKTVRIWDAGTGKLQRTSRSRSDNENLSVSFSPDGKRLASGCHKLVRIWDVETGLLQRELKGHSSSVRSVAFSPSGARLASGSWDETVRIWDAQTWRLQRELKGLGLVTSVSFSPNDKRLASCSNRAVHIWDAETGSLQREINGSRGEQFKTVSFSPNGERVAGGSWRTVYIWDAETGRLQRELKGHGRDVLSVSFSPDGRIASGGEDGTVRIWDVETGKLQRELKGHSGAVTSVSFSPNGARLASGSDDKTVRIWNVETEAMRKAREEAEREANAKDKRLGQARKDDKRKEAERKGRKEGHAESPALRALCTFEKRRRFVLGDKGMKDFEITDRASAILKLARWVVASPDLELFGSVVSLAIVLGRVHQSMDIDVDIKSADVDDVIGRLLKFAKSQGLQYEKIEKQEAYDCEGSHVNVYEVIFSIKKCGSTIKAQLLRRDSFFNSTPCYDIEALVIAEGKLQIARQAKDHDLSVGDVLASLRASPRVARPMRIESSIPPHRKRKVLSRGFRLGRLVQSKRYQAVQGGMYPGVPAASNMIPTERERLQDYFSKGKEAVRKAKREAARKQKPSPPSSFTGKIPGKRYVSYSDMQINISQSSDEEISKELKESIKEYLKKLETKMKAIHHPKEVDDPFKGSIIEPIILPLDIKKKM